MHGCAGKTVKSIDNACRTWAQCLEVHLLRGAISSAWPLPLLSNLFSPSILHAKCMTCIWSEPKITKERFLLGPAVRLSLHSVGGATLQRVSLQYNALVAAVHYAWLSTTEKALAPLSPTWDVGLDFVDTDEWCRRVADDIVHPRRWSQDPGTPQPPWPRLISDDGLDRCG